jgi:hypothetical protein
VRALIPFVVVLLAGCPICPTGHMEVVAGTDDGQVRPGEALVLRADYGDFSAGPGECGGFWYVNDFAGGSPEVGTIDDCGSYQAPDAFADNLAIIRIEAADWDLTGGCADCCPYASRDLAPVR